MPSLFDAVAVVGGSVGNTTPEFASNPFIMAVIITIIIILIVAIVFTGENYGKIAVLVWLTVTIGIVVASQAIKRNIISLASKSTGDEVRNLINGAGDSDIDIQFE
jgi:FlaA1/EpsC-like NDP-sugar epimerase